MDRIQLFKDWRPPPGDSLLLPINSPEVPGTHLINLERIEDCINFESPDGFWFGTTGLSIQWPNHDATAYKILNQ